MVVVLVPATYILQLKLNMIMKKLLWLLLLIVPMIVNADNIKEWSDGPLSWNDFKGPASIPDVPSYMKAQLVLQPENVRVKGKNVILLKAEAVMDEDRSFADKTNMTDQRLRLHQLQFDLLEAYRRDLQNDINSGMTGTQADERVRYYNNLYNATMDNIIEQTNNGKNDAKLQEWEYYARKGLDERELPPVREITQGPFKYGFYFGTGAGFPTSNVNDAFSDSWTFTAGLQFAYRRINMKADISYGQPKINNANIMGVKDQSATGTYSSWLGIGITAGYTVFDSKKFSITPYFGGMWTSNQWNVGNYETVDGDQKLISNESPTLRDFNWMAAIDFDFHFYTSVSDNAFFLTGKREQYVSSIRISPYIVREVYNKANPSLNGYQIGFTVAYVGIARSLGF